MNLTTDNAAVEAVRSLAEPLSGADDERDALLSRISGARLVLLGEASHGSHEFYRQRAQVTRRLIAERHGRDAWLVDFSTHRGSVTAASDWGAPAESKQVVPSRADSYEGLMHVSALGNFLLPLRDAGPQADALRAPRLERAIGVIYRPDSERQSHYFFAQLADQFDALIHIDVTRAVEPLERNLEWRGTEAPETYPTGV
jgi:erythromycin esterase-like protein